MSMRISKEQKSKMTIENVSTKVLLQGAVEKNNDKEWDIGDIAILFDYIQDETSTVEADITDNYVDSNYSIQDHIAVKPRIYRLKGCVGEVIYEDVYKFLGFLNNARNNNPVLDKTLATMDAISGAITIVGNYTQAAYNVAKQVESSIDRYTKMWRNFRNENEYAGIRQKSVYAILERMLQERVPVKLTGMMFNHEPFKKTYDRIYYLQSVSARQGENAFISDIEVTVKEFRIATTKTTKVDKKNIAGMAASQKTTESENGLAKTNQVPKKVTNEWTKSVEKSLKKVDTITAARPRNPIQWFAQKIKENQYAASKEYRAQKAAGY